MTFTQTIKQIKQEYFKNMKQFYNATIIFKIIFNNELLNTLYESDLHFRSLNFRGFNDENIAKLYKKTPREAITNLRVRGVFCVYLMEFIENLKSHEHITSKQIESLDNLNQIHLQLQQLAEQSFAKSNLWAIENNLPNNFDINLVKSMHLEENNNAENNANIDKTAK